MELWLKSIPPCAYWVPEPLMWLLSHSEMHGCNIRTEELADSLHGLRDPRTERCHGRKDQVEANRTVSTNEYIKIYSQRDFRDQCHHQGLERCRSVDSYYIPIQLTYLTRIEDRSENNRYLSQNSSGGDSNCSCCSRCGFVGDANRHIFWHLVCSYQLANVFSHYLL